MQKAGSMTVSIEDLPSEADDAWESGELMRAFSLFSEGAALGIEGCMLNLGYFYDEGIGVSEDKAQAMHWYKRLYRRSKVTNPLHSAVAASNIAILYREQGKHRLEFQWFQRSAQLNDGDSEVDLAKLYMEGKGVRRSLTLAKAALERALESNHITEADREEAADLLCQVERELPSAIGINR